MNWMQSQTDKSAGAAVPSETRPNGEDSIQDFSNTLTWPLVTQPIVTAEGKTLYREVLLRHDAANFNAGDFVKGLETSDRVEPLDTATLARVCAALAADTTLCLGLNTSRRSLISESWQAALLNLAPVLIRPRLVIEVTETAPLTPHENELLKSTLNALADQGFVFALDDLGQGTATVAEIKTWPLTYVKLDQSLTEKLVAGCVQVDEPEVSEFSLSSLLQLEQHHAWTLIAEGIEKETDRLALSQAGIRAFQGFAIERPQPSPY